MAEEELPVLERPLRFVVIRGQRGAIRANTLDELQEALSHPWSPEEIHREHREDETRRGRRDDHSRNRNALRGSGNGRAGKRRSSNERTEGPRPAGRGGEGKSRRGGGPRRKFRGR